MNWSFSGKFDVLAGNSNPGLCRMHSLPQPIGGAMVYGSNEVGDTVMGSIEKGSWGCEWKVEA